MIHDMFVTYINICVYALWFHILLKSM